MHSVKLKKVLSGEANYLDYLQDFRNNYLEGQCRQPIEKGRDESEEKKRTLCYELVQALDKTSVLFLRPRKSDGTRAWNVMCKRFKSVATPDTSCII